jgi:hypothetical protein
VGNAASCQGQERLKTRRTYDAGVDRWTSYHNHRYKRDISGGIKKMNIRVFFCTVICTASLCFSSHLIAADNADAVAQANNPLANMTAFNLQNYYIGKLTGSDESANQFWLRYAKPFSLGDGDWLMRASLPINTYPTPPNGDKETVKYLGSIFGVR